MSKSSDTIALAKKCRDNPSLVPLLLKRMNPLIKSVSYRYYSYSQFAPFMEDIISIAEYALIKAIKNFDFSKRGFFIYSRRAMEIDIRLFLSNETRLIRLPRYVSSFLKRMDDASFEDDKERFFTDLGIKSSKTKKTLSDAKRCSLVYSLDAPISEGGESRETRLSIYDSLEESYSEKEKESAVRKAMTLLSPIERYIIIHSFGIFDNQVMKSKEIASKIGVSTVTVNNRKKKALSRLEEILSPLYY